MAPRTRQAQRVAEQNHSPQTPVDENNIQIQAPTRRHPAMQREVTVVGQNSNNSEIRVNPPSEFNIVLSQIKLRQKTGRKRTISSINHPVPTEAVEKGPSNAPPACVGDAASAQAANVTTKQPRHIGMCLVDLVIPTDLLSRACSGSPYAARIDDRGQ